MLWYFQVYNKVTQLSVQFSSAAQSCPTLCNPMDHSTPGLPIHHQFKLVSIELVMPSNHLILCHPLLLLPSIFPSISSVQSLSRVRLFATPWIAAHQASLSITNSWSSLKLTSIESVMPSSQLIVCRPLLLLPPIPPSIRVFSNKSALHRRWPKYWSSSFSTGVLASASFLPKNTQDWSPLEWTSWISLQTNGLLRVFSNTTFQSINSLVLSFLHSPTLTSIHDYWKNHGLLKWVSSSYQVAKVLSFRLQHQSFQWVFWTDFL